MRQYEPSTASWIHPILGPAQVSYRGQGTNSRGRWRWRAASWAKGLGPTSRKPILQTTWWSYRAEQLDVYRNCAINKNKLKPPNWWITFFKSLKGVPLPISTQLTALLLIAASLGLMSMNGLFPIPMNTLSCIRISNKHTGHHQHRKILIYPHSDSGFYPGCELPAPTGSAPGHRSRLLSHLGSPLEACTCPVFFFSWTRSRNTSQCPRCFGSGLYLWSVAEKKDGPMSTKYKILVTRSTDMFQDIRRCQLHHVSSFVRGQRKGLRYSWIYRCLAYVCTLNDCL